MRAWIFSASRLITVEDAQLAAEKGVLLELNTAPRHCLANGHIVRMAERFGCELLLNSDASSSADLNPPTSRRHCARPPPSVRALMPKGFRAFM